MYLQQEANSPALSAEELAKRQGLARRKPYIAAKMARIADLEENGEISPIIRLEKSYLCNFKCTHCSAEYYMDRHLKNVIKIHDTRRKIDLADIRQLSHEADKLGIARFVITGGEPLVMKDFDEVVAAIDPEKHYIITDTNGWFLDNKRARHLKAIGVEKVQLSLDSFIEKEHDSFRNKPGSYQRVLRAVDASLDAGLNLILSTVLVKGRTRKPEFRQMCEYAKAKGIGLYVSYAKPTGSCSEHPEFVIEKEDADILRELEKEYQVFTHMTPSYGSYKGCIITKGIITVTSTAEVTPCPYIDFSLGNLRDTPLKEILARAMKNPWIGPYRPDCIIGEDQDFIKIHQQKTKGASFLPLSWGAGFSENDALANSPENPPEINVALFDPNGQALLPHRAHPRRHYFQLQQPAIDLPTIHERTGRLLGSNKLPTLASFERRLADLRIKLENDVKLAPMLNGICIPFILPCANDDDLGQALDNRYLPAVSKAFGECLPAYQFTNHNKSGLTGKLMTHPGTRHEILLARLANETLMGFYFPCLAEYALPDVLAFIAHLPENILLAGGVDTCAALIATPDLLLNRTAYPPLLWLAALEGEKPGVGYHFEAYGYNLTFNRRMHFDQAAECWNSGLVILA